MHDVAPTLLSRAQIERAAAGVAGAATREGFVAFESDTGASHIWTKRGGRVVGSAHEHCSLMLAHAVPRRLSLSTERTSGERVFLLTT